MDTLASGSIPIRSHRMRLVVRRIEIHEIGAKGRNLLGRGRIGLQL